MPLTPLAKFSIHHLQILDEKGNCDDKLKPTLTTDQIKQMYELMVLARTFDDKCLNLQRQGRIGTYASIRGQEACQIPSALALEKKDWLFPSFRETGALLARGTPMRNLLQYWGGDERGHHVPNDVNNFPIAIPVGTHMLHAVGLAWAAKLNHDTTVAVTYFGDGGTSEGDFHEAMNFAGVYNVPCVFLCSNNQWAISVPRKIQTASRTLAQKAIAYGFAGVHVDGNDPFAVYKATKDAVDNARASKGPTLIELNTYRIGDHTTADDATRYRDAKEVAAWKKKDPIERLRIYMEDHKLWDKNYEARVQSKTQRLVEEAVQEYENLPPPDPNDMFTHTFHEVPDVLKEQQDYLNEILKQKTTTQTP